MALRAALRAIGAVRHDYEKCPFGTAFRKPQTLWSTVGGLQAIEKICDCTVPHEILMGKIKAEVEGRQQWAWKTTLAGRYPVPLCRELASVFAHQCPRGGFCGLGESPSHPYWNVSLGQGARIAIDADPLPQLPAVYYDTEWHGATQFSIEGDSRLRRAAAIAKQQRVGAAGAAPTGSSNLSAHARQQLRSGGACRRRA